MNWFVLYSISLTHLVLFYTMRFRGYFFSVEMKIRCIHIEMSYLTCSVAFLYTYFIIIGSILSGTIFYTRDRAKFQPKDTLLILYFDHIFRIKKNKVQYLVNLCIHYIIDCCVIVSGLLPHWDITSILNVIRNITCTVILSREICTNISS